MTYPPSTIPLSEAILLGSVHSPQAFHVWFTSTGGRCALGAALETVGFLEIVAKAYDGHSILMELWPVLSTIGTEYSAPLLDEMICLNDHRRWPRPQIAEYVKRIELQQDAQAVAQPVIAEMVR